MERVTESLEYNTTSRYIKTMRAISNEYKALGNDILVVLGCNTLEKEKDITATIT